MNQKIEKSQTPAGKNQIVMWDLQKVTWKLQTIFNLSQKLAEEAELKHALSK